MCLEIKNKQSKVAEKNIVCYKVVKRVCGEFITIYQGTKVKPNAPMIASGTIDIERSGDRYDLGKGVIHTFARYRDAVEEIKQQNNKEGDYRIFKCTISAKEPYYVGLFGNVLSYASTSIYVESECDENTVDEVEGFEYFGDIKSYEDALAYLGEKAIPETGDESVDAFIKLKTIAKAWNKLDEFEIKFANNDTSKYYPWFTLLGGSCNGGSSSGFGCCSSRYGVSYSNASVGGRLYFRKGDIAVEFGDTFCELYEKYLMLDYPLKKRCEVLDN